MKVSEKCLVVVMAVALVVVFLSVSGCKKSESPAPPKATEEVASAAILQKTCPMMGSPIDKNVFTEYKGKKVYFCCAKCIAKFNANPEKYLDKLPQFQK